MMSQAPGVCPHDDRDQLAVEFLAGRLDAARAEAFEEHGYACDSCFEAVELAASVHAALRAPVAARPSPADRTSARAWGWAAAAVLAVAVGYGAYRPVERAAGEASSLRGREGAFALTVERDAAGMTLRWNAVAGADRYEVRLFGADGEALVERRTGETGWTISAAEIPPGLQGTRGYARVDAIDALGAPVDRSPLVPVEGARAP